MVGVDSLKNRRALYAESSLNSTLILANYKAISVTDPRGGDSEC